MPGYKILIEVDGFSHLSGSRQEADLHKERFLTDRGYIILRFSDKEIRDDLPRCLAEIEATLSRLKTMVSQGGSINSDWKDSLKSIETPDIKPPKEPAQTKKPVSIEEYFLSLDKKE